MSVYLTVAGHFSFPSMLVLLGAIQPLLEGGTIVAEGGEFTWFNEGGFPISDDNVVDSKSFILTIPSYSYRNFGGLLGEISAKASGGEFKGYCTNSDYTLMLWRDGVFTKIDDVDDISKLAGLSEQSDIDVLSMQSEDWEELYGADFQEALDWVMERALEKMH
jgi:hypothetical protein